MHEGIEIVITTPTREEIMAGRRVSSCIDHICIRAENTVVMSSVIKRKLADHYFVGYQFVNDMETKTGAKSLQEIEIIDNSILGHFFSTFDLVSFCETMYIKI